MRKYLFCSHGLLANGMLDTLKFFSLYDDTTMMEIPFYTENVDEEKELQCYIDKIKNEDTIIIFTDLFFGSVNQSIMEKCQYISNVHIITGMNLMVVLELVSYIGELTEEIIQEKVLECQKSILYTRQIKREISEEDE